MILCSHSDILFYSPRATTSSIPLRTLLLSPFNPFIIPEHVYVPSSPSSTLRTVADAEGPADLVKDAGRGRGEYDVVEVLFHITVCGIRPSVKMQGKETEEPTAAYTTEELS